MKDIMKKTVFTILAAYFLMSSTVGAMSKDNTLNKVTLQWDGATELEYIEIPYEHAQHSAFITDLIETCGITNQIPLHGISHDQLETIVQCLALIEQDNKKNKGKRKLNIFVKKLKRDNPERLSEL